MLKKTIKYTNLFDEDEEIEGEFWFHLKKSDLAEMTVSETGGLEEYIKRMVRAENMKELMALIKNFILKSYGEIQDDGVTFLQNKEVSARFASTEAYSTLFLELTQDLDHFTEFMKGVMPKDIRREIEAAEKEQKKAAKKAAQAEEAKAEAAAVLPQPTDE